MLRLAIVATFLAVVAVPTAGGTLARSTAGPLIGTWSVKPGPFPQAPWADGSHKITIRASSESEAFPVINAAIGVPGSPDPCGGTFEKPTEHPGQTWLAFTYDWQGGGTLMGCTTNPIRSGFYGGGHELNLNPNPDGSLHGNWYPVRGNTSTELPFDATKAAEGTEKTVTEPAPGRSVTVSSPQPLPADAKKVDVSVSSSSGDLKGETIVFEGEVRRALAKLVAECWLISDFEDRNGDLIELSPHDALIRCVKFIRYALLGGPALSRDARRAQEASTKWATSGCSAKHIAIAFRTRKGRIVSIGRAKNQKLKPSSVRYSCTASGGTAKITVTGPANLRKALGKKLDLMVVRAKKAPRRSAKLTFTFGW